jgi:crossover junction endodeoxyribonuclease RuvC
VVVLGIDPGSRRCGYGAVSRRGTRLSALTSGVIVAAEAPLPARLARLFVEISQVIQRTRPDAVSVESAFCGASARSALVLGQARGVVLAAAASAGLPVYEYAPAEVKRAFTGSGRAEKTQMMRTAQAMFGIAPDLSDEADALAIAVCHLSRSSAASALRPSVRSAGPTPRATARGPVLRPAVRRYGSAS